jgi:hypothetical protein
MSEILGFNSLKPRSNKIAVTTNAINKHKYSKRNAVLMFTEPIPIT